MGAFTYEHDVSSSIAPARLFNAFILNGDTLIPKCLPQAIKSVETLQGDGGPGSIKLTTFGEGSHFKSVKHQVDALDKENHIYKYSVIEGDALHGVVEKVSYEVKIVPSADGGSIVKTKSTYHTKGDAQINEEEIKAGKGKAVVIFEAVQAYLIAHPDEY